MRTACRSESSDTMLADAVTWARLAARDEEAA